jgi:hypothetical protein
MKDIIKRIEQEEKMITCSEKIKNWILFCLKEF